MENSKTKRKWCNFHVIIVKLNFAWKKYIYLRFIVKIVKIYLRLYKLSFIVNGIILLFIIHKVMDLVPRHTKQYFTKCYAILDAYFAFLSSALSVKSHTFLLYNPQCMRFLIDITDIFYYDTYYQTKVAFLRIVFLTSNEHECTEWLWSPVI